MSTSTVKKASWLRAAGVSLLWLGVGGVIFGAMTYLDLDLNLFDWHPTPEASTWTALAVGLVGVAATVPLSLLTRHRASTAVGWFVVVGLAIFGLYLLPAESLSPNTLLGRDQASPLWYRGGRALALALPLLILAGQQIARGGTRPPS